LPLFSRRFRIDRLRREYQRDNANSWSLLRQHLR
jgi:hypothetical protein